MKLRDFLNVGSFSAAKRASETLKQTKHAADLNLARTSEVYVGKKEKKGYFLDKVNQFVRKFSAQTSSAAAGAAQDKARRKNIKE